MRNTVLNFRRVERQICQRFCHALQQVDYQLSLALQHSHAQLHDTLSPFDVVQNRLKVFLQPSEESAINSTPDVGLSKLDEQEKHADQFDLLMFASQNTVSCLSEANCGEQASPPVLFTATRYSS